MLNFTPITLILAAIKREKVWANSKLYFHLCPLTFGESPQTF
ncbi:hypothetical protein CWATWH0402_5274 [Crocosphaera watsonii WH 0402]|uniref:Uncharacterized protein n=1 Tax=Crocosphaera watsonii WH 0402 TaxID=1284629 RepID=T2JHJ2_CROWT|nr:hypothetical protein CWATWH0402_5274 [Crocosphaera watsonii WH 0402]